MKALVTGGAGFIGSHLVDQLISGGMEIHVMDNLITGNMQNLHPLAIFHKEDICSSKAKEIMMKMKPDIVFHLAAQADVGKSLVFPTFDANVNIVGTLNILEACIEAKVKKLILSSTSGVYGDLEKEMINEEECTVPISSYGLSKLTAESYIRLIGQYHNLDYTILRYGNVYGPRQSAKGEGGVIAIFLDKIQKGESITINGDGEQTRDFIYVKDVVQANIFAIHNGNQKTLHVSTGNSTSINHLVEMIEKIHGSKIIPYYREPREGDIKHSCLDNSKASNILGWEPQFEIFKGLYETYTYKENL
jgi:UDP-glucose 4-epimerase